MALRPLAKSTGVASAPKADAPVPSPSDDTSDAVLTVAAAAAGAPAPLKKGGLKSLAPKPGAKAGMSALATTTVDLAALTVPHVEPPPRRTLPPTDPPFACTTGEPHVGKTVDFGFMLPTPNTAYLGDPGAFDPITARCGYTPEYIYNDARNLRETTDKISWCIEQGFTSIVIDDWAARMQSSLSEHRINAPKNEKGNTDGFYPYNTLNDELMEQREVARYAGVAIFGNFWIEPPKNDKGKQKRGGAMIPGNRGKEIFQTMMQTMYRVGRDESFKPWNGIYKIDDPLDPYWRTRDRYDLGMRVMPMNMAEIMRYVGFGLEGSPWTVERIVDWQEDVVDEIALRMWHEAKDAEIAREAMTKLADGSYPGMGGERVSLKLVEWTLRDAVDRCRLWRLTPRQNVDGLAKAFGF